MDAALAGLSVGLRPAPSSTPFSLPQQPRLVVFSGGTAFNSAAEKLRHLTNKVAYVLPVSDDGGSTAEVVRVLGGPAVGDIRSRCLRLADDSDEEGRAVKALLAHRLPSEDAMAAKMEWYRIVEGEHPLWEGLSDPYKHVIRAFLVHFHTSILRHSTEMFDFRNGSIGNFFFAGSRTFFRSLEAAIFLFSRVARLPEGSLVLPAICTEERITLGAELEDGTILRGQNQISHPPPSSSSYQVDKTGDYDLLPSPIRRVYYLSSNSQLDAASFASNSRWGRSRSPSASGTPAAASASAASRTQSPQPSSIRASNSGSDGQDADTGTGGAGSRTGPGARSGLASSSSAAPQALGTASPPALPQPEYEVFPRANPLALHEVQLADAIVYGMGSLYTSVCPCVCLDGMGEAIAARDVPKVMCLNGSHDRETASCGAHDGPMTASDMVQAVCDALNRRRNRKGTRLRHAPSSYVTALLVPRGGDIRVEPQALQLLGVHQIVEVASVPDAEGTGVHFEPSSLVQAITQVIAQHGQQRQAARSL